ncbi:uncharacterized protein LOC136764872 [Amia ocellicauda]|uniref:uncharacterized protein LOC136764872 n=1 Tax=Amia ocellicauda TaxID=2972642 RepID=UPI003463BBD9
MGPVKKRKSLSLAEKVKIIHSLTRGENTLEEVEREYSLPRTSVYSILRNRANTLRQVERGCGRGAKRVRRAAFGEVDRALLQWYRGPRCESAPLTSTLLREKAKQLAATLGYEKFRCSFGWLESWKKRHDVTLKPPRGDPHQAEGPEHWVFELGPAQEPQTPRGPGSPEACQPAPALLRGPVCGEASLATKEEEEAVLQCEPRGEPPSHSAPAAHCQEGTPSLSIGREQAAHMENKDAPLLAAFGAVGEDSELRAPLVKREEDGDCRDPVGPLHGEPSAHCHGSAGVKRESEGVQCGAAWAAGSVSSRVADHQSAPGQRQARNPHPNKEEEQAVGLSSPSQSRWDDAQGAWKPTEGAALQYTAATSSSSSSQRRQGSLSSAFPSTASSSLSPGTGSSADMKIHVASAPGQQDQPPALNPRARSSSRQAARPPELKNTVPNTRYPPHLPEVHNTAFSSDPNSHPESPSASPPPTAPGSRLTPVGHSTASLLSSILAGQQQTQQLLQQSVDVLAAMGAALSSLARDVHRYVDHISTRAANAPATGIPACTSVAAHRDAPLPTLPIPTNDTYSTPTHSIHNPGVERRACWNGEL